MIEVKGRNIGPIETVSVRNDKDVVRLVFRMKNRLTELLCLEECDLLYINYMNGMRKDRYLVTDRTVDGDTVTFSWTLGINATASAGETRFVLCALKTDGEGAILQEWNSCIASFDVKKGIEAITQPTADMQDAFAQMASQIAGKLSANQGRENAGKVLTVGADGNVIPTEGGGGNVDFDETIKQNQQTGKYGIVFAMISSEGYETGKAVSGDQLNELITNVAAYVSQALAAKQNVLTAGNNIMINGDTISARDTTYFGSGSISLAENVIAVRVDGQTIVVGNSGLCANTNVLATIQHVATTTYNKPEVDTLLAGKQAVGDYATNTALTNGLASKADASTTYTKTEVDTALTGKQNVRTETNVTDNTSTALTIDKDTDYVFKTLVGTMNFSLASTFTSGRSTLTFTTGDTPAVTIASGVMPVMWHGEVITSFEANTTYELDFRVVALPVENETTSVVELVNTLIIAGGAVTEGS